jgi:phosphoribosylamine--glycine ligase
MKDAISAMGRTGQPYRGILYGQFMNTRDGPVVIEFNARFGDPEAMNVLTLLESDLAETGIRLAEGTLSANHVTFSSKATVCKYIVPEGYPEAPVIGSPVTIGEVGHAILYYANVTQESGHLITQSSRTLAFVGRGDTLAEAESIAEAAASAVTGRVRHRRDIGTAALLQKRIDHMKELA